MPQDAAAQSRRYCDNYARDYANARNDTGRNVVGGAVGGAVVGGIIGSVTGSWGRGAAIGSGVGAAAGIGKSSVGWDRDYRRAYNRCMRGEVRAQRPAPVRSRGLEPWSPAWYDYCSRKYRSFNPDTGYFTTYGGKKRFCR
ncbi:BA14K family protein [Breoghania sp. L-A4]|nr:BA14K family protein [Breoghania sp. L-A4]